MKGLVVSKNAGLFSVEYNNKILDLSASGKMKKEGVFVGDEVEFEGAINFVYPRKNLLIRPPMANVDKMFIVISPIPRPDFLLVDKVIIYCYLNDIEPVIVINKIDVIQDNLIKNIEKCYNFLKIIKVCAKTGDVSMLRKEIVGICALAGQSAVGKSSLINSIVGEDATEVGALSKKIERGKQTTRIVKLYKFESGYLGDTAGFSMLDLSIVSDLRKEELSSYYPDFLESRGKCKYRSCNHTHGDCGVMQDVASGKISQQRYLNYLKLYAELENGVKHL